MSLELPEALPKSVKASSISSLNRLLILDDEGSLRDVAGLEGLDAGESNSKVIMTKIEHCSFGERILFRRCNVLHVCIN